MRVLTECLPFGIDRLREVQRETEQALLEWWHATSSNKMRWQINLWLLALGSQQIPECGVVCSRLHCVTWAACAPNMPYLSCCNKPAMPIWRGVSPKEVASISRPSLTRSSCITPKPAVFG